MLRFAQRANQQAEDVDTALKGTQHKLEVIFNLSELLEKVQKLKLKT